MSCSTSAPSSRTDEKFAWALLDAEKVGVMPGSSFGEAAAGHIRISLCQPDDVLQEAAKRLRRFASDLWEQGRMSSHSHQGPRRHHRRRRLRLLGRLSSGQARLDRRRAARAQAAHLRHDLARGRPDRPAARLAEHDAAREIFGRPLRQARSRDRRRHRHAPGRLDHRRADRGAQARNLPAGLAGARLRRRRARDFAERGQGDVPASQRRRTWSAPCTCRSTASATRPTSPWRWPRARGSAARRSSRA